MTATTPWRASSLRTACGRGTSHSSLRERAHASTLHPLFFFLTRRPPPRSTLFPYTTLFRSFVNSVGEALVPAEIAEWRDILRDDLLRGPLGDAAHHPEASADVVRADRRARFDAIRGVLGGDRKSTRQNSSH